MCFIITRSPKPEGMWRIIQWSIHSFQWEQLREMPPWTNASCNNMLINTAAPRWLSPLLSVVRRVCLSTDALMSPIIVIVFFFCHPASPDVAGNLNLIPEEWSFQTWARPVMFIILSLISSEVLTSILWSGLDTKSEKKRRFCGASRCGEDSACQRL